jgi:hypothetical protein
MSTAQERMEYVVQLGFERAQKEIHEQILKRRQETLDTNKKIKNKMNRTPKIQLQINEYLCNISVEFSF